MICQQLDALLAAIVVIVTSFFTINGHVGTSESQGPMFISEPPTRIDFSNSTGTKIACAVRGNPAPTIKWIRRDGMQVNNVATLREIKPDGTMHLLSFRAEEYRQDIHAVVYRCVASNPAGTIVSKEVNVRGVVKQYYEVQVYDEYVIRGNTAALRCHIPSFVRDYVKVTSWLIDEILLPPSSSDEHYTITSSGELYIRQVEPEDGNKSYRCKTIHRLTNETQISAPSRVIVTDPQSSVPPRITHSVPNYVSKQGETAYIPCVAQGFPVPSYRWYRGQNKQMEIIDPNNRFIQYNGLFMIQRTHISDSGVYACVVNNSVGEERVEITLLITAPLAAEVQPRQQVIDAGKIAVFNCVTSGHPLISVSWFKNGEPLTINERVKLTTKNTLEVLDIQRKDIGMYQCFVENEAESVQATAELKLGDAAPLFHYTFPDETHHEGPQVSLKCVASANPPPIIEWTLDDSPVADSRRFNVGSHATPTGEIASYVNISRVRVEDGGDYACAATNKLGRIKYSGRLNVYGLPYVRVLSNVTVVAGDLLRVTCRATGYPIETIYWERDEKQLPANLRQTVFPNGTLEISRVERPADQGRYTCIAANAQGQTARRNLWVTIMASPIIDKFSFPVDLREGMRTRVSCVVSDGDLPIVISWKKDGRSMTKHVGLEIHTNDDFSSSITFRGVTSAHNGNYTCVATNAAASVNYSAELLVHVPPRWVREPEDVEVLNGETAILHCQADGFPKPKTLWLKGRDSPGDYKLVIGGKDTLSIVDNGSLIIEKTIKMHQGYYLCQAANGIGSGLSKVVLLKVKVSAYFENKHRNYTVERQTEAVLRCNAKGDSPVDVMWVRNKERINFRAEPRLSLKEYKADDGLISELIIKKVEPSDAAVYGCVASNPFGHDETWMDVTVQELPGPPANMKVVEVSSKFVQLTWTPGKTGNSIISKYIIRYKRLSGGWSGPVVNGSVETEDNSVVIHQLVPGASYKFWASSVNNIGESTPSDAVEVTCTEEIPGGPPLAVEAKAVGADSIKVTWKFPKKETWNGEILGYYIGYKIYDNPDQYVYKTVRVTSHDFKEEIYLTNLQKFTKYSVVVQAFNRMGSGPDSDEVIAYTLEDVPSESPQNVQCTTTSSQGIEVNWSPPPPAAQNGIIRGFKIKHTTIDLDDGEDELKVETPLASATRFQLHSLAKYTNYSIQVLAYTRVGEGVASSAVYCRTDEDVPGPPAGIKALIMSSDAIIVTWKPPDNPNGIIMKYTLYMRVADTGDHNVGKHILSSVPHLSFVAQGLKENLRYEFWVTASTVMGEGESTKVVSQSPKTRVPAKISSFSDIVVLPHKELTRLGCRIVGIPTPTREWKYGGKVVQDDERIRVGQDGSLIIQNLQNSDSGNYSCHVFNNYGKDDIIYCVIVKAPPISPSMIVNRTTRSSITLSWKAGDDGGSKILGYSLSFKRDFGEWEEIQIKPDRDGHTLDNLNCGSRYQLYLIAFNKMGDGQPSGIITVNTEGSAPQVGDRDDIVESNTTFVTIRLDKWPDGGCRVLYFVIQYKAKQQNRPWTLVSNNIQSTQAEFIITDLLPGSMYSVQVTAHNDAGSTVAEYDFRTLPAIGSTMDQTLQMDDHGGYKQNYVDLSVIVPISASLASVIIALVAVCLFTRRRKYRGYQHSQNGVGYTRRSSNSIVEEKARQNNNAQLQNHVCNAQLSYSPLPAKKNEEPASSVANTDTKSTKSTKSTNSKNYQEDVAPYATFSLPSLHDDNDVNSLQMKTFYEKEIGLNKDPAISGVEDTYAKCKKRQSPPKSTMATHETPETGTSVILSPSHFSKAENPYDQYQQRRPKEYATLPVYQRNPAAEYERLANVVQARNKIYEFYPKPTPLIMSTGKSKDSSTSNESSPDEEQQRHLHRRSRGRYGNHAARIPFLAQELIAAERWPPIVDDNSPLSLRPQLGFSDSQEFSAAECDRDIMLQYRKNHRRFRSRSSARIDDDDEDEDEDDEDERVHDLGLRMPFHGPPQVSYSNIHFSD